MARPLLPPKYVNAESDVVFSNVPDGAFRFYAQIRGLAWQSNYQNTPELTMEQLEEITGKRKTAIYGYMTLLRTSTPLRWAATHKGTFIFSFEQPVSAIPEIPNLTTTTEIHLEDTEVVVESPKFRENGKTEGKEPMFDTSIQEGEQLYTKITGQVTFPPAWKEVYIRALADVLYNNFERDIAKAAESGKPVFARYCNTRSNSTGKTYSRTGTGWLDWWITELAPKPEEQEQPQREDLSALKDQAKKDFANANAA